MDRLRSVCTLLAICGCWRPASWDSPPKEILYRGYTVAVWLSIHLLSVSQILDLAINVKTQDDFSDNFYVTLAVLCICVKMCTVLASRAKIGNLIDLLRKKPFSSLNTEEDEIRARYDKVAERNTIAYTIIIKIYVLSMCITSIFTGYRHNKLLYRAWLPYDCSTSIRFTATYIHQIVAVTYCSFITVACDSLFSGFLIHTYCHFEILGHRLKSFDGNKSEAVKDCAYLHDRIYKYATMVNSQFKVIVLGQSLVSMTTISVNLYQLTQRDLGSKLLEVILYSFNTLVQIFYYCWYGNEVKLKSLEVPRLIFQSNWPTLDTKAKRMLLMMIKRSRIPIEFTAIYMVSMDLQTFMAVLKTSYSAYNLLQ
ncbi:putative odorant receptor 92a [Nomia melanderi]|uniref:putative odorant receptor 92a n=1 Tax=Nomia melanderi TaxID=2448451 RepID=UPI003FCCE0ED